MMTQTETITVAQALVRFLAAQHVERDGVEQRFFAGCFGIFGHGNVAGIGQALQQHPDLLPLLPGPQRAGDGAHRRRLREASATGWRRSPARRRSARARPTWSPARRWRRSTGCRCCCCPATSSPAACPRPVLQQLEVPARRHGLGQRLLPAGLALLGPHQPARAAHPGRARGDARADRPGRDRRGDAGAAAGRADRGVRLARGVPRAARLDGVRQPPAPQAAGRARPR